MLAAEPARHQAQRTAETALGELLTFSCSSSRRRLLSWKSKGEIELSFKTKSEQLGSVLSVSSPVSTSEVFRVFQKVIYHTVGFLWIPAGCGRTAALTAPCCVAPGAVCFSYLRDFQCAIYFAMCAGFSQFWSLLEGGNSGCRAVLPLTLIHGLTYFWLASLLEAFCMSHKDPCRGKEENQWKWHDRRKKL